MGKYLEQCEKCGDETITYGWYPERCPFCELAEVQEKLAKAINDYETAVLREHRMQEQRDTLVEACRKLMKVVGAPGTNEWQEIKECDAAYLAGKKALAAVKGGSND